MSATAARNLPATIVALLAALALAVAVVLLAGPGGTATDSAGASWNKLSTSGASWNGASWN